MHYNGDCPCHTTGNRVTITVRRPIPTDPATGGCRRGWAKDAACRVLAGCYEATYRPRDVYVAEQIGTIEGWSFCSWDGTTPLAVKLYVRVTEA